MVPRHLDAIGRLTRAAADIMFAARTSSGGPQGGGMQLRHCASNRLSGNRASISPYAIALPSEDAERALLEHVAAHRRQRWIRGDLDLDRCFWILGDGISKFAAVPSPFAARIVIGWTEKFRGRLSGHCGFGAS
jgi:hypothetical protein